MGLITRALTTLHHRATVWHWRWRYWWLDTPRGAQAQALLCAVCAVVVVVQAVYASVAALAPRPPGAPQHSFYWWVIYLVVAIVAAAVSYAMRPKQETPAQKEAEGPTTEDGQSVIRYWGTHWIGDEFLLAWKIVGRDKIKAKGGK